MRKLFYKGDTGLMFETMVGKNVFDISSSFFNANKCHDSYTVEYLFLFFYFHHIWLLPPLPET